jgi:hypothetical protein
VPFWKRRFIRRAGRACGAGRRRLVGGPHEVVERRPLQRDAGAEVVMKPEDQFCA